MKSGRHVLQKAGIAVAVSGGTNKQGIRRTLDCRFHRVVPDGVQLCSTLLALCRIARTPGFGEPDFKFLRIVSPTHIHNPDISRAEIIRHFLKVRCQLTRPFQRRLKWEIGKLIVETRYDQPYGRVSTRRDSGHMRAMNVEANHFLQFGPLVHLVGSVGAHFLLQHLRFGRVNPVLHVQSALELIAKIWIFLLLRVRQRI